ncbi:type I site-specific restriction-modification system R (restriction) subunit [Nocardiopsis algeriensis]|uniref:Type I site-specific restriction-modification system R (Restriction) subunit n=1 Tax=Nocardiopsis algeriensis TaxID=1478215 RepID=A0A841IQ40_9ACTN|nr:type I site-specific restriction-modification system R (restriction) subunit [Nocardiopsis algeriensis]
MAEEFVASVSADRAVYDQWCAFVVAKRAEELEAIIAEQKLQPDAAPAFIDAAFRDGQLRMIRTAITKTLPPASRFSAGGGHGEAPEGGLTSPSA